LAILREDGLEGQVDHVQPPSNDASVCLLDAIFRTVKDKTRIKQSKDQDIVWEFKTNRANSEHIRTITYDQFDDKIFIVQHSPCSVAYNVTDFKLKNQDKLTP
jgi:myosin heavy subunit